VDDDEFEGWFGAELAGLPGAHAVALGGSRAVGTNGPDSDWDFAVYYRASFDPSSLRAKGWRGTVSELGGWGGGVMNGGAWLTVAGRTVDVHFRDLGDVERWCDEALHGRFDKQMLMFYVAGIPTYVLMAELAVNRVLTGQLPRYEYPDELSDEATRRWREDAIDSLGYAARVLQNSGDSTVAMANASRSLIEYANGILARGKEWVLNEKGIVRRADLAEAGADLLAASTNDELLAVVRAIRERYESDVR